MLSEIKNNITNNNKMQYPREFNKEFDKFKGIFEPFKQLNEGDKVGKDGNDNYIIFKSGILQKAWRNYYGEDRKKTVEYLTKDFEEYSSFLDRICINAENDLLNIFKGFSYEVSDYSQKIIQRLYNLKTTYKDDSDNRSIKARIDSIILVLIDYKEKITRTYEHKNLAHMSLYLRKDLSNSL